jgi:hypothetical protein
MLNDELGRLFNGYMNKKEVQTGKVYREWTDIIDKVRDKLNKIRKVNMTAKSMKDVSFPVPEINREPKFKEGDLVYRSLDYPENALGQKQPTANFRRGDYKMDRQPRKIEQVFVYAGDVPFRYQLNGLPHVSFAEWELKPAKEEEEMFEVRQFLKSRKVGNEVELLTWYWGEKKKDASWQIRSEMIKYVPELVQDFVDQNN